MFIHEISLCYFLYLLLFTFIPFTKFLFYICCPWAAPYSTQSSTFIHTCVKYHIECRQCGIRFTISKIDNHSVWIHRLYIVHTHTGLKKLFPSDSNCLFKELCDRKSFKPVKRFRITISIEITVNSIEFLFAESSSERWWKNTILMETIESTAKNSLIKTMLRIVFRVHDDTPCDMEKSHFITSNNNKIT